MVKRCVERLLRRCGRRVLRDVLTALAELENFPPAARLWNAGHEDVPLECFIRWGRAPVFRIREILAKNDTVHLLLEYGGGPVKERMTFRRDERWILRLESRRPAEK